MTVLAGGIHTRETLPMQSTTNNAQTSMVTQKKKKESWIAIQGSWSCLTTHHHGGDANLKTPSEENSHRYAWVRGGGDAYAMMAQSQSGWQAWGVHWNIIAYR